MRRKGIFLIFSLWLFVFLSILSLSLGFRTYLAARKTKMFVALNRAAILADSGLDIAKYILEKDDPSVDHDKEKWAKPVNVDVDYQSPVQKGSVDIEIKDASWGPDINLVSCEFLDKVLLRIGVREHEAISARIADYVDEDRSSRILGSEDGAKNSLISVMQELFSIDGVDKDVYSKIEGSFIVGTNSTRINVNTASRENIENIVSNEELKKRILNKRFAKDNQGYFNVQDFALLLSCVSGSERAEAEKSLNIRSDYFYITSVACVGDGSKKISCLYKRGWGIIYSYEE